MPAAKSATATMPLKDPDAPHPAAEVAALQTHLATKYTASTGVTLLVSAANTRRQNEQALTAWAKTLPKGS